MLQDLDELVLKCRDERARAYIREAVLCCKAGAYRSAIVSTWIAVSFDIVDKIHELSLTGDKESEAFVTSYETAIANDNPDKSLKIERDLLNLAKEKYELISANEYTDLSRLQLDRHRCAHPTRLSFNEVFSPPAELARLHIRSAVEYLLQHEPSQGKAALQSLVAMVKTKLFPFDPSKARKILDGSALRRARPALVRNFVLVLLKASLAEADDFQQAARIRAALKCVMAMHPATWEEVLGSECTRLYRHIPDENGLARGLQLLTHLPELANYLEVDQIVRFEQFLAVLPDEHVPLCEDALIIPKLAAAARAGIAALTAAQLRQHAFLLLSDEVRDRVVKGYCSVMSFDTANTWGKVVREFTNDFTEDQTRKVLAAAATNNQIQGSFQLKSVLACIRTAAKLPPDEMDALIAQINPEPENDPGFDEAIPL